jgi:hypothetical protein
MPTYDPTPWLMAQVARTASGGQAAARRRRSFWPASAVAVLLLAAAGVWGQVLDDFSEGGWKRFDSTPGTLTAGAGKLRLVDSPEPPDWVTASKVFAVDVDRTPVFMVRVAALTDQGTVKLIRRQPYDKREVLSIDQPGLYAVDVRKVCGWAGRIEIETCLYAIGDQSDITYEFVKYVAALTPEEQRQIAEQATRGNPKLQVAPFELVPLFNGCSYYFASPPRDGLAVEFRRVGEAVWRRAHPPVYVPEDGMCRGSVVYLDEDTAYELRVTAGSGAALAQGEFRTWASTVPIAETIVLDETSFGGSLRITRSGTPEGWVRYTAKQGFVLRNERTGPLIELSGAKYIILDGLTLRGGLKEAISIRQCQHVRIVNCDIAGWGRPGTQRFDLNGMYYTDAGEAINWDTGIVVRRSLGTVIERCYIHDPVTTANSWYYAHPAGPQAVGIDKPRSTVLRYNDFVGSDEHRWNDATEGAGNFDRDGGFNRDADIYGNFVCFANDDALEIDGGQTNVRVFGNWYEGCLCGVSIQGCMSGPSYVFDNLLVNLGDERGLAGQTIKTSSNQSGPSAVSFIFGNTTFGPSSDLRLLKHLRIVARNNLFAGKTNITGRAESPQSDCDYNLQASGEAGSEVHGLVGDPGLVEPAAGLYALREGSSGVGRGQALDNFSAGAQGRVDLGAIPLGSGRILPVRPVPVLLDRNQLQFTAAETAAGATGSVTATVPVPDFSSPYRIAQNEAFDWFTVTPAAGTLESGRSESFTVTVRPERMTRRALYRGAFLVRLANGLSRPVMVYAATGYQQAVQPAREGVWTQFVEAEAGTGGSYEVVADPAASGGRCLLLAGPAKENPVEYRFAVPRAGKHFVVLRVRGEEPVGKHDAIHFAVDAGPQESAQLRVAASWSWCLAAQNRSMSLICLQSFELAAGDHVVRLSPREPVLIDLVALTEDPGAFE